MHIFDFLHLLHRPIYLSVSLGCCNETVIVYAVLYMNMTNLLIQPKKIFQLICTTLQNGGCSKHDYLVTTECHYWCCYFFGCKCKSLHEFWLLGLQSQLDKPLWYVKCDKHFKWWKNNASMLKSMAAQWLCTFMTNIKPSNHNPIFLHCLVVQIQILQQSTLCASIRFSLVLLSLPISSSVCLSPAFIPSSVAVWSCIILLFIWLHVAQ